MDISLIIPAFNEGERIRETIATALEILPSFTREFEVVVVDDGSTDETRQEAKVFAAITSKVSLYLHPRRLGKGAAVRTGVLAACGSYRIFTDADLSYSLRQIPALVHPLQNGCEVAIGRRTDTGPYHSAWRRMAAPVFRRYIRSLTGLSFRDPQCGFKGFRAAAATCLFSRLQTSGFSFDVEILLRAHEMGLKIEEVPVSWQDRGDSSIRLWKDGPRMAYEILRLRRRV